MTPPGVPLGPTEVLASQEPEESEATGGVDSDVSVTLKPPAATGSVIHVTNLSLVSLSRKIGQPESLKELFPDFTFEESGSN